MLSARICIVPIDVDLEHSKAVRFTCTSEAMEVVAVLPAISNC